MKDEHGAAKGDPEEQKRQVMPLGNDRELKKFDHSLNDIETLPPQLETSRFGIKLSQSTAIVEAH